MLNKQHYIILVLVVLLVAVLLSLPSRTADRLKLAISGLFLPLIGLAASTHEATAKTGDAVTSRRNFSGKTRRSAPTIFGSVSNCNRRRTLCAKTTNSALMLNFRRQKAASNLLPARVIARDPETWWRSVWIDLGSRTPGMRTNLAVLTAEGGLAGKVVSVGEMRSRVALLGDPSLRVAVLVGSGRTG